MRVGVIVVDNKAGVNGVTTGPQLHVIGGCMASYTIGCFKNSNVVSESCQPVGAAQAGNARPDYCNLHPRVTCHT